MTTSNTTTLAKVQLQQVIEQLKDMSDSSLQICHNNYCIEIGYEDIICDNDEYNINKMFITPFDVLRNIEHYNLSDNYFYLHNGNLISFDYLTGEDSPITFSELAQWIVDNDSYSEYNIEVTTLDDMLASIEDNINDADLLVLALMMDRLSLDLSDGDTAVMNGYKDLEEYYIETLTDEVSDYDYNQLNDIILMLGINYN